MRISRRTFGLTLAAAAAYGVRAQAQAPARPSWAHPSQKAFYEDEHRLIVHKNIETIKGLPAPQIPELDTLPNDPGDTAQREGFTWFGIWLLQQRGVRPIVIPSLGWLDVVKVLESPAPGEFRRHPTHERWSKTDEFSRDQQTPFVAALGGLGPSDALTRLWQKFDARGRMCQNGEPGGPEHQNLFNRARRVTQLESFGEMMLASMVYTIAASGAGDRDDVDRDLNYCVNLAAATVWQPTPTSDAAICEYVRRRPVNYGCYLEEYRRRHRDKAGVNPETMVARIERIIADDPTPECPPVVGALRWYFRYETGAPWGPAGIWEQVVRASFLPKRCK